MNLLKLYTLLLAIVAGVACSTLEVSSDHDESFDFTKLKSFDWKPVKRSSESGGSQEEAMVINPLVERRIVNAVNRQLTAKGFQKQESNPDFLVDYALGVKGRTVRSYRQSWHYSEGELVLDFLDANTKQLIWRGRVADAVEATEVPDEASINEIIRKMLEGFPPA